MKISPFTQHWLQTGRRNGEKKFASELRLLPPPVAANGAHALAFFTKRVRPPPVALVSLDNKKGNKTSLQLSVSIVGAARDSIQFGSLRRWSASERMDCGLCLTLTVQCARLLVAQEPLHSLSTEVFYLVYYITLIITT